MCPETKGPRGLSRCSDKSPACVRGRPHRPPRATERSSRWLWSHRAASAAAGRAGPPSCPPGHPRRPGRAGREGAGNLLWHARRQRCSRIGSPVAAVPSRSPRWRPLAEKPIRRSADGWIDFPCSCPGQGRRAPDELPGTCPASPPRGWVAGRCWREGCPPSAPAGSGAAGASAGRPSCFPAACLLSQRDCLYDRLGWNRAPDRHPASGHRSGPAPPSRTHGYVPRWPQEPVRRFQRRQSLATPAPPCSRAWAAHLPRGGEGGQVGWWVRARRVCPRPPSRGQRPPGNRPAGAPARDAG